MMNQYNYHQLKKSLMKKNGFNFFHYVRSARWSTQQLIIFTEQLTHLLHSGLPLDEALTALSMNDSYKILQSLTQEIIEGKSLQQAMALFPQHFPPAYRAIIGAGEQSGDLIQVLTQLKDHYEDKQRFSQQMLQALLYPCTVALVGCATLGFLFFQVIPTLLNMVATSQGELPLATRFLLNLNYWFSHYSLVSLVSLIIVFTIFILAYGKKNNIRYYTDNLLLKIPFLGNYLLKINLILYLKSLVITLGAGNSLITSLTISNEVFTLTPLKKKFNQATHQIETGYSVYQAWQSLSYFSAMNLQLIASGERSGYLIKTLANIGQWETEQLQRRLKYFITLFESSVIVIMGIIVLWLVIAILLPIFNLEQLNGGLT